MNASLLQNTLLVGVVGTVLAMGSGLLTALTLSTVGRRPRNLLMGGAIIALALPPFMIANTWLNYLGEGGAWRDWFPLTLFSPAGAVLIFSLWLWPITAILVWGSWQRLELAHLEVEPDLRGTALLRFLLLPLARGPLAVAGLLTLALAANNLAVPALLQVQVYPAEVWLSFSSTFWVKADGGFDWLRAAALCWPLVALPLVVLLCLRRRVFPWPTLRGGTPPRVVGRAVGRAWRLVSGIVTVILLGLSVGLPVWQMVGTSETWKQLYSAVVAGKGAIFNSLFGSAVVATVCLGIALTGTACRQTATSRFPIPRPSSAPLLWVPFLVPGVLVGIAAIQLLNRPATAWLYQSFGVVILALTIRYLAIAWSLTRHALHSTDPELTDAARMDGASRWQILRHVQGPQMGPQLAVAWCVVFLLCLWDVETLVLIIPPGGETVALRVFNMLHYGHTAHVNALCVVLLGLAVIPLLGVAVLMKVQMLRRKHGVCVLGNAITIAVMLPTMLGCSARLKPEEARVDSRLFDRVKIIASRGVAPGQVNKPRSVAVDHDDNLYVLDFTGRVQKFGPDGQFLKFWQMPETKQGNPKGLSVDREGNIIVVEPHYSRVNLFTPEGMLLMRWGEKGTNFGQFSFPRAAAVNSRREWFVSEYGVVDRVQAFAFEPGPPPHLRFLESHGHAGAGPGEFNRAEGLSVDGQDHVLVADAVNHRVQMLDAGGGFLRAFGRAGDGVGELSYPYDVCEDRAGRIFVCEFGNSRIQVFDAEGRSIEVLGGPGADPGRFNNPWGVALDSRGNLYVADSQNHRVQEFIRSAGAEQPIADSR